LAGHSEEELSEVSSSARKQTRWTVVV